MPEICRGEKADQSFFYNLKPRKIVEMYEGWWQAVGMYGKKKKRAPQMKLCPNLSIAEKLSS